MSELLDHNVPSSQCWVEFPLGHYRYRKINLPFKIFKIRWHRPHQVNNPEKSIDGIVENLITQQFDFDWRR